MDYVAASVLAPHQVAEIVVGMAAACKDAGCALIGGETAEMPGVYAEGAFDVVGAVVGMVDRSEILPRMEAMQPGDVLLGLPSSGPHTNGYSLIRQAIAGKDLGQPLADGRTLGDALLEPHRAYVREISLLQSAGVPLLGLAHITGGGLTDNLPRILPAHLCALLDATAWETPELFGLLKQWSGMSETEAFRVFNLGIGMALVVPASAEHGTRTSLPELMCIGALADAARAVRESSSYREEGLAAVTARLAVLISGNGSNLQAILDAIRLRALDAEVCVVVSNRKAAYGLERVAKARRSGALPSAQAVPAGRTHTRSV